MLRSLLFAVASIVLHILVVTDGASASNEKLQVHLIMHSHDDPGWLKTADQYYTGANASVYLASVQYIFDSVVTELQKEPDRKFTFCEISFMSRWYYEQSAKMREQFKNLVKSGQITIVNGGWVMHDEAAAHYMSMIDQTTLGHKFLKEELNYLPRVGWQIDPFGHSNTHAWLSSAVGFDSLFFGRIDYQDRAKRMSEKNMEMVWKGSASDADQNVFTGAFTSGNYGAPSGYCFDTSCHYCRDDPIVSAPYLEDRNLESKVAGYIDAILKEHSTSRGNNIMLEVGADFTGDNSHTWYKNMDILIEEVNKDPRFHVFYSDPHTYTLARAAETDIKWSVKTDDFFPYSDHEHAFWAGYFSSRPTLKILERTASSLLQSLKQLTALPTTTVRALRAEAERALFQLTAAVGLVNHHDAVTGTSKQHVADDYNKILSRAMTTAEGLIAQVVGRVSASAAAGKAATDLSTSLKVCRALNESICDVTQSLQPGGSVRVEVYNPLPRQRSQQITVPLSSNGAVQVVAVSAVGGAQSDPASLQTVPSAVLPNQNKVAAGSAPYLLTFTAADVPALSTVSYLVRMLQGEAATAARKKTVTTSDATVAIASDKVSVAFDPTTGLLESVTRLDVTGADGAPLTAKVSQDLAYYKSFGSPGIEGTVSVVDNRDPHLKNIQPLRDSDSVNNQPGGAYLMRTSTRDEVPTRIAGSSPVQLTVVESGLVKEVHQQFGSYASQVVRLRQGSPAVELEWTVGPVPINDAIGKEVISKFTSDLQTGGTGKNVFYTDSNGREFMRRQYNYRPTWDLEVYEPIAGNYYPVSTAMYVRDEDGGKQLSILPDRGQAGASLRDGEMELLIHRRLVVDDNRGVEEPLNETTGGISHYPDWTRYGEGITVSGKHRLLLSNLQDGVREVRSLMDELYLPFLPLFGKASPLDTVLNKDAVSAPVPAVLGFDLPPNVHLATLEATSDRELLVRLAHQYAVGEDATLSQSVTVDLFALLAPFQPTAAVEMTLSANQEKAEQLAGKIAWPTMDIEGVAGDAFTVPSTQPAARPIFPTWVPFSTPTVEMPTTVPFSVPTVQTAATPSLRRGTHMATTEKLDSFMVELGPMQIKTFKVTLAA